jgi:23S rRNA pseudouridine1911/1915/1917 synthase
MQKITPEISTRTRIDAWLATEFPDESRGIWQKRIKSGEVRVNKRKVSTHYKLQENDVVTIEIAPQESSLKPEDIPLDVIFEDDNYVVINKSAGMVVHPGSGNLEHTLVNALLYRFKEDLSDTGGSDRPGIVHRLDKDTSGLIIVAKTNEAHRFLSKQFEEREIKKIYKTLVLGHLKPQKGTIDAPLNRSESQRQKINVTSRPGSRHAITHYQVLKAYETPLEASFLSVEIETGRTHQIRVHLNAIGFPVIGDVTYGNRAANHQATELGLDRQFLHAEQLTFTSPTTKKEVTYQAPLSDDLNQFLKQLS